MLAEEDVSGESVGYAQYDLDIHRACRSGNLDGVRTLLLEDPTRLRQVVPETGAMPLGVACSAGHLDVVKYLLDQCDMEGEALELISARSNERTGRVTALHVAASQGHADVIRHLCFAVDDGDLAELINTKNGDGDTPLHCAVCQGHPDAMMACLRNGADYYIKDNEHLRPFAYILLSNMTALTKTLFRYDYISELGQTLVAFDFMWEFPRLDEHKSNLEKLFPCSVICFMCEWIELAKHSIGRNDKRRLALFQCIMMNDSMGLAEIASTETFRDTWQDQYGRTIVHYACMAHNPSALFRLLGDFPELRTELLRKDFFGFEPYAYLLLESCIDNNTGEEFAGVLETLKGAHPWPDKLEERVKVINQLTHAYRRLAASSERASIPSDSALLVHGSYSSSKDADEVKPGDGPT